ncbi:uncharacterized protein [Haliotis cracherodii]|uniref:uncharacterized protein n=1 Tax=Haliotis cracherodii TaxID=6455 RepID=UPI0039EAB89A
MLMAENPVYWTAGNMTASEARDETSVADGGPGNDDVADLYSKVQKPCIKGVNRTARNDDILLGGRMVKELTTTVELSELYAKVQKSDGGEAEGRASTDNTVPFGGWVPEEQSRDVNTVETIYSKVQRSEVKPKTEPESGDICAKPEKRKEIPSDKLEEQS